MNKKVECYYSTTNYAVSIDSFIIISSKGPEVINKYADGFESYLLDDVIIGGEPVEWDLCQISKTINKSKISLDFQCPLEDFYISTTGKLHFDFKTMKGFFRFKNIKPNGEIIPTRYVFTKCKLINP